MARQFTYKVTVRFATNESADTELIVVASAEEEAEDEAMSCLESFDSISDWSLKPTGSSPADQHEEAEYQAKGAFAVFDPSVLHERA